MTDHRATSPPDSRNGEQHDPDGGAAEGRGWRLGVALAGLILLLFLAGVFAGASPSFEAWQAKLPVTLTGLLTPGSLSPAHERFGARCSLCHQAAFNAVADSACTECHKELGAHRIAPDAASAGPSSPRCAACHAAHRNKAAVVDTRSTPCVDCHSRQDERLAANRDFGAAHAPFRVAVFDGKKVTMLREDAPVSPTEKSGMKFSHAAHLKADGVSSPEGQTVLGCTSCHRPDEAGQSFKPPHMESGCQQSGCHRARFEEPIRGVVPHVTVRELMDRMRTFFAASLADDAVEFRRQCGGTNPTGSAGRRLLDCANDIARETAARTLFRQTGEDLGCALCHELVETGHRETPWKIEPVRWTTHWHPSASFPHARHATLDCGDCHSKASSKKANDLSIPGIAKCRECHAGIAGARGKLATGCADCHIFHRHAATASEAAR